MTGELTRRPRNRKRKAQRPREAARQDDLPQFFTAYPFRMTTTTTTTAYDRPPIVHPYRRPLSSPERHPREPGHDKENEAEGSGLFIRHFGGNRRGGSVAGGSWQLAVGRGTGRLERTESTADCHCPLPTAREARVAPWALAGLLGATRGDDESGRRLESGLAPPGNARLQPGRSGDEDRHPTDTRGGAELNIQRPTRNIQRPGESLIGWIFLVGIGHSLVPADSDEPQPCPPSVHLAHQGTRTSRTTTVPRWSVAFPGAPAATGSRGRERGECPVAAGGDRGVSRTRDLSPAGRGRRPRLQDRGVEKGANAL